MEKAQAELAEKQLKERQAVEWLPLLQMVINKF